MQEYTLELECIEYEGQGSLFNPFFFETFTFKTSNFRIQKLYNFNHKTEGKGENRE